MAFLTSYWSVVGVSSEARDAAVRAASSEGVELGAWLSDLIHRVSAEEMKMAQMESRATTTVQTKMTSIERAMLRPDATEFGGNLGPA